MSDFVCSEECYCLTSTGSESVDVTSAGDLSLSQEETDTRMILHCMHIGEKSTAEINNIVRSPDTDVLVLLLKYARKFKQVILFGRGTGNKRRLLNVKQITKVKGQDLCSILPALHVFYWLRYNDRGKTQPKSDRQAKLLIGFDFDRLGNDIDCSEALLDDLEAFV